MGVAPRFLLIMRKERGTTLLELMVVVVIIGILMAAGMPSLFLWLGNVKVRGGADALQNGLRLAQTEAVRRNDVVKLILTSDTAPGATSTGSATGTNWVVLDSGGNTIQAKAAEGTTLTQTPSASTNFKTAAGVILFNALGGNDLTATTIFKFSGPSSDHPMSVLVTPGGRVRLCDLDAASTNIGNTRTCE